MLHVFIINPTAGQRDATEYLLPQIEKLRQEMDQPVRVEITEFAGHATQIAREIGESGEAARLYACGGDGTLSEVLQGAYRYPNLSVGHIPCASGNDWLKNFGTAEDFSDLTEMVKAPVVRIDLIQVGEEGVSASICSVGLDARVAYGIRKFRRLPGCSGQMGYILSIVDCMLKPIGDQLVVEVDGKRFEGKYIIVCIANGSYYGGGFCAAPNARMDDGELDVILADKVSRLKVAKILGAYKTGDHFLEDHIDEKYQNVFTFLRGKEISITSKEDFIANADGECQPRKDFHVKILPKAGRVIVPERLVGTYERVE